VGLTDLSNKWLKIAILELKTAIYGGFLIKNKGLNG
jgi:hypothetical protein